MQQMQNICALRKDGTLHPVTIALSPARLEGRQLVIVSIRDNAAAVAARQRERETYERLLRAQRLEDLGMLSCGIAHDFRNLLSIVLGNAELAMYELTEETISQRAYLQAIRTSAAHLQELSGQILSYAAGGETPRRPLDLNEAAAEMAVLIQVSLPRTTTISCELAPKLPKVLADPGHIAQILLNLILNAKEAIGSRGGNIVVRTGIEGDQVFIEVEDDGCGIEEEKRERILDTFYTTKEGGKGLGLAVVKGIVEQYGGSTRIDSSVGAGSLFRVLLPACDADTDRQDNA